MKRMKALGVVEWHLTRRQAIYYLLSIGMPTAFYLFFSGMYQDTPGAPAHFMRDYLLSMTAFFHDVYGYLFLFQQFLKPIDSTIGKSLAPYPGIYGRILSNKGCGSLCRFSPIDWSCLYRGPCGAPCEYVPTRLDFVGLYSHPRKPSVCGFGSGLDPASF